MAAQDIEEFYFAFAKQNNGQNIIDIKIFFTSLQQNYGYFLVPHKILLHLGNQQTIFQINKLYIKLIYFWHLSCLKSRWF
jgi:hypothetical protein